MADVKWIKLSTGLPDNRKLKQIRRLPEGDTIALMWVFLMCLAGEVNDSGMVYFTKEIAYTEEMLADQFDIEINTVRLGLETFKRFGMIDIVDNIICLSSWEKWQSTDSLERIREQNRIRKQRQRERQKLLTVNNESRDLSRDITQQIRKDKEEEKDKEEDKKRIDYNSIKDDYNRLCPSLPSVKSLSDSRKKAIRARLNQYSVDDIHDVFKKAEASDFLKGKNSRDWCANFDWLLKDANMAKVLSGNYDNKHGNTSKSRYPEGENDPLDGLF